MKKDIYRMWMFILIVTIIITILDLLIIKVYSLVEYFILNFFEWMMFGVGWYFGKGYWKK